VSGTCYIVAENADKSETFGVSDTQTLTLDIVPHPCIALSGDCLWSGSEAPQAITKGQSVVIRLQNWNAGGKVSLYIVPAGPTSQGCKSSAALGKQQTLTSSNSSIGQRFALPSNLQVGKAYTICATGQSSIGGEVTAAIQVRITKAVGAAGAYQRLLLVLGACFASVSLLAFVVTMPKRAASVPQPVARR
jgi:hypothetical protein